MHGVEKMCQGGFELKKQYLEIGKIVSTHGIMGEVRVQPWCDDPALLEELDTLYYDDRGRRPLKVLSGRVHKNIVILKIEGITTVEAAQAVRNRVLYVDRRELELDEGSYFIQDLIGMRVYDADVPERCYGTITDVLPTGANDVYEITDANGVKRLVAAVPQVVLETDVDGERMVIRPLKGLFDDEN